MGTGGIEVSPLGPDHYNSINSSCLYPLFKKKHNRSHPCIKLSISAKKINPKPSLAITPMHLSKLCNKDRACWVLYVLTPSSLWFFSRGCGRQLRRRWRRLDRVSPAPKPCLWTWVATCCIRCVIKFTACEPLCKNLMNVMYKIQFFVVYAMYVFCTISVLCAYQLLIQRLIR